MCIFSPVCSSNFVSKIYLMNQAQLLRQAEAFVKTELQHDSSGHDWYHICRVTKLARKIALQEKADVFICEIAALLHDIADEKLNESKEAGLQKVENWLTQNGANKETTDQVMEIISTLSYSAEKQMQTLEGKVVQDADRLDALGAIGIARTFAYSGWKGQLMYDPEIPVRENLSKEEYRNGKSTALNHFHEKLFKLKDLLNTAFAKEIARERHRYMQEFVQRFMQEWEGR